MKKPELIHDLAEKTGLSLKVSTSVYDALIELIKQDLVDTKHAKVSGLGVFEVGNTSARRGYDFRNGTPIDLEPQKMVRFRAGKKLKNKLNHKE